MKKSELIQFTQIIEHLVRKEVRKQLPSIIAETFQNMMGNKQAIVEHMSATSNSSDDSGEMARPSQNMDDFKLSMKELFAGIGPQESAVSDLTTPRSQSPKHYTNNPAINQILNETVSDLRQRDRMVGGAAAFGGYSPSVAIAASAMPQVSLTGVGEMVPDSELPSFSRIPTMPGASVPISKPPPLIEGRESTHAPMAEIPSGISVLDVARQVPLAAPVAQALTKNYSAMMKLVDSKRRR
jgi:hypothetical protein